MTERLADGEMTSAPRDATVRVLPIARVAQGVISSAKSGVAGDELVERGEAGDVPGDDANGPELHGDLLVGRAVRVER
jgi:hypothetical protein